VLVWSTEAIEPVNHRNPGGLSEHTRVNPLELPMWFDEGDQVGRSDGATAGRRAVGGTVEDESMRDGCVAELTIPLISYWTVSGWVMGWGGYPWVWREDMNPC
jgi:hypothetical protein